MRLCEICGADISHKKAVALSCSVACNHARLAARRKAQKWAGVSEDRPCEVCGTPMLGKRPHAKCCSRSCKARASDLRRISDGRAKMRYSAEAARRREVIYRRQREISASPFKVSARDWHRLIVRYDGCCAYCHRRSESLHVEHVIPISRGGQHRIGNILPACPSCNLRKGTKLLAEFRLTEERR